MATNEQDELDELIVPLDENVAKRICEIIDWIYMGDRNPNQVKALTRLDDFLQRHYKSALQAYIAQHTKEAERCARHDAFEEIGAIGANYADGEKDFYRLAVERYVIAQRKEWAAVQKRKDGAE